MVWFFQLPVRTLADSFFSFLHSTLAREWRFAWAHPRMGRARDI